MRIQEPFHPSDKYKIVRLDGQDVTHLTKACDDAEGWVDLLHLLRKDGARIRFLLLGDPLSGRTPLITRVYGKVEIDASGVPERHRQG